MRAFRRFLILVVLLALAGAAGYYFTRPKPVEVLVREVDRGMIESTVVNTRAGTVEPCRRAKLSPEVGGRIAAWPVSEGMEVRKGDLLLALASDDLQARLDQTGKEVEAAAARSEAACLAAEVADRQASRIRELAKTASASEERVDEAVTTARVKQAECRAARSAVAEVRSRLAIIRTEIRKTTLAAPFAGIVAELNGELGEYLTPSPPGIQTLPAVDLIDPTCYYVVAPIDEVDAAAVHTGMPARITMDAFRDRSFPGTVSRVADYVLDREKQARTVDVEVTFDKSETEITLLAGYSADAEIILDRRPGAVRVPAEAVVDERKVFVFLSTVGVLEARTIVPGLSNWEYTEVVKGVRPGELVVVTVERQGVGDGAAAVRENRD